MIRNFRHKGLERVFTSSETRGISTKHSARITRILDRLESASKPEDMNLPGYGFHGLSGYTPKRYAVKVSGNWRITFAFDGEDALDVNWRITTDDAPRPQAPTYPPRRDSP